MQTEQTNAQMNTQHYKIGFNPNILLFIAFALSLTAISSCGNDDPDYLFEVEHGFDIILPAGQSTLSTLIIPFRNINSQIAQELNQRGLSADDVKAIQTSRARIDLTSFDGDLSDLRSVVVNVYTGQNATTNPYEAGYTIQIQDRVTDRLDIVPSLTNLSPVLRQDIFSMELEVDYRVIVPRDTRARFTIGFGVVQ